MSPRPRRIASLAIALLSVAPSCVLAESAPHNDAAAVEFFEKKVRPILVDNCYGCHSANTNAKGGLRVDDRKGLIDGGVSGSAVVPGDVDASLLIQAVRYADDGPQMPPNKSSQRSKSPTWKNG